MMMAVLMTLEPYFVVSKLYSKQVVNAADWAVLKVGRSFSRYFQFGDTIILRQQNKALSSVMKLPQS